MIFKTNFQPNSNMVNNEIRKIVNHIMDVLVGRLKKKIYKLETVL